MQVYMYRAVKVSERLIPEEVAGRLCCAGNASAGNRSGDTGGAFTCCGIWPAQPDIVTASLNHGNVR